MKVVLEVPDGNMEEVVIEPPIAVLFKYLFVCFVHVTAGFQ